MGIEAATVWARVDHVAGLAFTRVTLVTTVAGLLLSWILPRLASPRVRDAVVAGASIAVCAVLVGVEVTLGFVVFALGLRLVVEAPIPVMWRGAMVMLALAGMVMGPVVYIAALGTRGAFTRELTAFATAMAVLRFAAFAMDRLRGHMSPMPVVPYLAATLFFPTFVNGPLEVPRTMGAVDLSAIDRRAGLGRILRGTLKIVVVGLVLGADWLGALRHAPDEPVWRLWGWAILLYAWFYVSFSAWTDVAVGVARLCGRRVPENFDRPWLATDPGDFWRRWHVSFGTWLRDYVYIPLGGNRRHRVLNIAAVFALSAWWHVWGSLKLFGFGYYPVRAWWGFLLWGALHALAVGSVGNRRRDATGLARLATFVFAAWAWMPFFMPGDIGAAAGTRVLLRMLGLAGW